MTVIELHNVACEFSEIQNLELEVRTGEVFSLASAVGGDAGRLARLLALEDDRWSGEFFLLGNPIHEFSPAARREVRRSLLGAVFLEDRLVPELNVFENLELPLTLRTRRREREERIGPLMDGFGLGELRDAYPRALSRRETQLVKIASAVVASPPLVIADDLTGCLRRDDRSRVAAVLRQLLSRGSSIAVASAEDAGLLTRGYSRRAAESVERGGMAAVPAA